MAIERLDLGLRNALRLNKAAARNMHITDKLYESIGPSRYNVREGNKLFKYTIIDDNIKIDTFEKRLGSGTFVRIAEKILGDAKVFNK